MRSAILTFAKVSLRMAKIPIPEKRRDVLKKAYELLKEKLPIVALAVKFGKFTTDFNEEDWQKVLEDSFGRKTVREERELSEHCESLGLL